VPVSALSLCSQRSCPAPRHALVDVWSIPRASQPADLKLKKRITFMVSSASTSTSQISSTTPVRSSSQQASTMSASSGGNSCGRRGYDKTHTYSYDNSGRNASFAACSAKCKADRSCVSFAFGKTECDLYKVSAYALATPPASRC